MSNYLIDTDIFSMYMRNNSTVVDNFSRYFGNIYKPTISILTYYEILSGLTYRDSKKQLSIFIEIIEYCRILELNPESIKYSATIYANLRKSGVIIDDVDILIAGICMSNKMILVTNNEKHYGNIPDLEIENWSKE